jgi:predicted CopG family antitoxin
MPTISVSKYVKGELDELKEIEEHRSYDSVIRSLIERNKEQCDE